MASPPSPEDEMVHLKESVQKQASDKLTFTVKIHKLLAFTQQHPECATKIGLIWTNETGIFLTHSPHLAQFLGIRVNSINTNLREHGFHRVKAPPLTAARLSAITGVSLPDSRHWKKTKHTLVPFSQTSDEFVAQQVDHEVRPAIMARRFHEPDGEDSTGSDTSPDHSSDCNLLETAANFPLLATFLPAAMLDAVNTLLRSIKQSQAIQITIFELAFRHWTAHTGQVERTRLDTLLHSLFPGSDLRSLILQTNCRFLLGTCMNQQRFLENMISFIDFLRFFLRYGNESGIEQTLHSLTNFDTHSYTPSFQRGFCLGFNIAVVRTVAQPGQWAIIEGDACDTFSLILEEIITIQINPTDESRYLNFKAADGTPVFVPSWLELLQRFGLQPENGVSLSALFDQSRLRDIPDIGPESDDFGIPFFRGDI
jgi:hypothetical protein